LGYWQEKIAKNIYFFMIGKRIIKEMKKVFLQTIKHTGFTFACWTGVGKLIELAILMLLTSFGMPRVIAYIPSFLLSMVWNFTGSFYLVFAKTGRKIGESLWHYLIVSIGALAVNQIFLALIEFELGLFNWGVLLTGGPVFLWSYFWNKSFTFGKITRTKKWFLAFSTVFVLVIAILTSVYYYDMEMLGIRA